MVTGLVTQGRTPTPWTPHLTAKGATITIVERAMTDTHTKLTPLLRASQTQSLQQLETHHMVMGQVLVPIPTPETVVEVRSGTVVAVTASSLVLTG